MTPSEFFFLLLETKINHDLSSSLFDRKVRQTTVKNTQTETHPLSNILNPTIQQISNTKEQNPQNMH